MAKSVLNHTLFLSCLSLLLALSFLMTGQHAHASRIAAVVDGAVVTDYDVSQRQKLDRLLSGGKKRKGRTATLQDLVDDKLKLFEARRIGTTASDAEINRAMKNMASNVRMSKKQMVSVLRRSGIVENTLKSWLKVQISWNALIRARFNAQVRIEEADIARAIVSQKKNNKDIKAAIRYTLTQITFVVPKKVSKTNARRRLNDANRFRTSFKSCAKDINVARRLQDVAISRLGRRLSTDLPETIAKELANLPLNGLTKPQRGENGYDMYAICEKKEMGKSIAMRNAAEGELRSKRGEALSRTYIRELRAKGVVDYR
ncbi:MAG: peptidylprolyl isomerase [Cohaesibacter sp.]|nr:peptidylprolyl isomerase [Cohaesibacter sp.]